VSAHKFSESAKQKIEAAGGTCIVLAADDEAKDS
jgi:ribosomal protein L18E